MVKKQKYFHPCLSTFVLLFFVFTINQIAFAQTFNVSTTKELRQAMQNAAGNGQNDLIILADGTYKTTDDGGGTFVFLNNEDYDLTIQGSSAENAVLSGDDTDRVLSFLGINCSCMIYLNNLTIQKGFISGENGGGIYSNLELTANNINLYMNVAEQTGSIYSPNGGSGSAIYIDYSTNVRGYLDNSIISYNNNLESIDSGIGHSAVSGKINISNSTISNNLRGAIYVSEGNVYDNIIISNNSGYAIAVCGNSWHLSNSLIENNDNMTSPLYGSVIHDGCSGSDYDSSITNTIIRNNSSRDYVFRSTQRMKIANVIMYNNTISEGSVELEFKDNNEIINSLFIGSGGKVSFADESKILNSIFFYNSEIVVSDRT